MQVMLAVLPIYQKCQSVVFDLHRLAGLVANVIDSLQQRIREWHFFSAQFRCSKLALTVLANAM